METLSEVNWLVQSYQHAREVLGKNQQDTVTMQLNVLDSKIEIPEYIIHQWPMS